MPESVLAQKEQKYIKGGEYILYLAAVFFYTMMTGVVNSYRNDYLVNVLRLTDGQTSLFNMLTNIIPFVLNFFIAMYIDTRKAGKGGKFKPLALLIAIPTGVFLMLSFWAPKALVGTWLMIYIVTIAVAWSVCTNFADCVNKVAVVMTPNMKERDSLISFKGILSSIGFSAPLVVELVVAIFVKDKGLRFICVASVCSVVGVLTMLIGMKGVKERITYNNKRKNPLVGYADVLKDKYAWPIIISEFLKNFRAIANYMMPFIAEALLGPGKLLLFGLPTGIGTAVGMLLINALLKKFNSKQLYIASGVYSVFANCIAFAAGYTYFKSPSSVLQVVFVATLFLIGLQFGASNLLPQMFQADVLEDIELKTGKRLDASLPFVINIFTMVSTTIAGYLSPKILYGTKVPIIAYVQASANGVAPEQSLHTKIMLLFFYTIFHGLIMFLAGVPFFFYKLTGKTKEDIHTAVIAQREKIAAEMSDGEEMDEEESEEKAE